MIQWISGRLAWLYKNFLVQYLLRHTVFLSPVKRSAITTLQSGLRPTFSYYLYCVRSLYIRVAGPTVYHLFRMTDFWETFSWLGIFPLRVFARNLLRGNRRRNIFFHISFWYLTWDMNPIFICNKPTHYLLDYGNFCDTQFCILLRYFKENCTALVQFCWIQNTGISS